MGVGLTWKQIISFIILVPIAFFLLKAFFGVGALIYGGIDQGTIHSFNLMVEKIKGLKEPDTHNMYLKDGYILVGFNKGQDKVQFRCGAVRNVIKTWHQAVRPAQCYEKSGQDLKKPACLCLCRETSIKKACMPPEKCEIFPSFIENFVVAKGADNNFGSEFKSGENLVLFNRCSVVYSKPITFMNLERSGQDVNIKINT